jgi:hypothetical protein
LSLRSFEPPDCKLYYGEPAFRPPVRSIQPSSSVVKIEHPSESSLNSNTVSTNKTTMPTMKKVGVGPPLYQPPIKKPFPAPISSQPPPMKVLAIRESHLPLDTFVSEGSDKKQQIAFHQLPLVTSDQPSSIKETFKDFSSLLPMKQVQPTQLDNKSVVQRKCRVCKHPLRGHKGPSGVGNCKNGNVQSTQPCYIVYPNPM